MLWPEFFLRSLLAGAGASCAMDWDLESLPPDYESLPNSDDEDECLLVSDDPGATVCVCGYNFETFLCFCCIWHAIIAHGANMAQSELLFVALELSSS